MVNGVRHLVQAAHQRSSSVDASRLQHFRSATDKRASEKNSFRKVGKGLQMFVCFFFCGFLLCCVVLCCVVFYIFLDIIRYIYIYYILYIFAV